MAQARVTTAKVDEIIVILWLHTATDPDDRSWTEGCELHRGALRDKRGDIACVRTLVITDGGAPNARQRKLLAENPWTSGRIGPPCSRACCPTLKRGLATALSWLNPEIRFFEPHEPDRALGHLELSGRSLEPVWQSFRAMQDDLPPVEALRDVGKALDLAPLARPPGPRSGALRSR